MIVRLFLIVALCAIPLSGAYAAGTRRIDGQDLTLVFEDPFDKPAIDLDGAGRGWVPWFHKFNVRTLKGNQELELYSDRKYLAKIGLPASLDPFSYADGVLTITGQALPQDLCARLPVIPGAPPLRYISGMISSELIHAQTYGYFEARLRLPAVAGTWPAFWLMPKSGGWPPEIDIFEVIGQEPSRIHQNVIRADKSSAHTWVDIAGSSADWHSYGLLWTRETLVWFIDGVETKRVANTIHEDMYMILNLAIGGRWPGTPPGDAAFPAPMEIDAVRAYTLTPSH